MTEPSKSTARKKAPRKKAKRRTKKKAAIRVGDKSLKQLREENTPGDYWPWPLRPYQQKAMDAFDAGKRKQGLFWHRRAGKDIYLLSKIRREARHRIGNYVHFMPKTVQARRAIWNGIDPRKGQKFLDIAFGDMVEHANNTEMLLEFYNGSTYQLLGSDNYDRIVGSNIVGAGWSEYAICDPRSWDYMRPIFVENGGWADFITTFRSRNHAWQMAQSMKDNPDWYIDIRGVDKTVEIDGSPVMSPEQIQAEIDSGMSEAMVQQEYYCNPKATSDGAIYGAQVDRLRDDDSRQRAVWDPNKPVYCVWNIDLPVFCSYIMIQPGHTPRILEANILEFQYLGEALAEVNKRAWPIHSHLISGEQRGLAQAFMDLETRPTVVNITNDYVITSQAASFIERMQIRGDTCQLLLDGLSGYVRRIRFDTQTADLQFSDDAVLSWHWRLAYPLEIFSIWDYSRGDQWGKAPDYSIHDRIAKVVL